MTGKPDGHAHSKPGHRPANHPALWLLAVLGGLCLSCALWSLTGPHKPAGSKPRAVSEEALEALARNLALRGGKYSLRPPAASWGAALGWGPTAQPSARSGKHVLVSLAEVVPERLNVLAASLRRWAPATKLVVFAPVASGGVELLEAAGAEVVPFTLPNDATLDVHRFELYRSYLASLLERDSEAGVVLADSPQLLVQSDPWQHPLVQRLLDEDALLFTLEGGLAVGDVPLKALPQLRQLVEACYGAAAAQAMAGSPMSSAGLVIGGVGAAHKYVSQLLRVAQGGASPGCRQQGGDQAVHNYLLHQLAPAGNLSFAWHVRRNWESPLHAMGFGWPVVVDKQGVLSREEGDVPPIVYGYEAAEGTAQIYRALYPLQPLRSGDLQWDGPECVQGAHLDGVKACQQPKDKGAASASSASSSAKSASRAAAKDAADHGAAAKQAAAKGEPAAAQRGGGAGPSKDRRRLEK